jgi:type I restriction enzyme, S subunit
MGVTDSIDITPAQRKIVVALLTRHIPGVTVWAYGSRVKWTSRPDSDLDLIAFSTPEQRGEISALKEAFEESSLPFRIDVLVWDDVPDDFRKNILERYAVLVEKPSVERGNEDDRLFPIQASWEVATLGEACRRGGGGIQTGPFGSQLHAADYVPFGIPTIMPQNIGDNRINEEGIARITLEDAQRLSRYLVREGDIVYSRRGDVERRTLVRQHEDGWLCGTGCLRVSFGQGVVHPPYAAFYLGHPSVREWIVRHAHGATMPNLNTSILSALPFVLPPFEDQRAIARILGDLDDKIELNRQINQSLEQMAQAIFKSWFVDFEPVRIRRGESCIRPHQSGDHKDRPYLTPEILALFPDELVDSELGEIPKGWEVSAIGDEVTVCGGGTPSTANPDFWDGDFAWVTPKDLSQQSDKVLIDSERKISAAGVNKFSSGQLPIGTVLLSSRAPIGYLSLTMIPVSINQGFIAMICNKCLPNTYVLQWTTANLDAIKQRGSGTTFAEISKANFRQMRVLVPSEEVLTAFQATIEPLYAEIAVKVRESRTLATLRDTLLPKLLSGNLAVNGAEEGMTC